MRHRLVSCILSGAMGAAVLLAAGGPAMASTTPGVAPNYTFADGSKGFAFMSSGGFTNPEVLVGFNPQPEPPGFGGSRYERQRGTLTHIFTPASGGGYSFVMSFVDGTDATLLPLPSAPNSDGVTVEDFMIGANSFHVAMSFSGPGAVRDWAAFNPQPDPPGVWFGGQFSFTGVGDPDVRFEITENGAPLTLSLAPTPEPSTWAMMLVGIAGLGALARARRLRPLTASAGPRSRS